MHQQAPSDCQISSAVAFQLNSRLSAGPKTRKPLPHPWYADPNRDTGAESLTSNRRFLVRNRRKQTSPQNKATQPVGAPGIGTCPKSPRVLRRCAEPLGTWKRTKRPPSSTRKQQKPNRWRPTETRVGSAIAGCAKRNLDRTKDPLDSALGKNKFVD